MAAAITTFLANTEFSLTEAQLARLSGSRSLIQHLLGAAPLKNADHVARRFLPAIEEDGTIRLPFPDAVKRLGILCNSESLLPIDYSACMHVDPVATIDRVASLLGFSAF